MKKGAIGITKHGLSKTPAWMSWNAMMSRTTNPKAPNYKYYGARGIKVCERWKSFLNFLEDMGERLADTSLDRLNVDGDYEPGNCRWANIFEQQSNRTNNRMMTIDGITMNVSAWAKASGLPVATLFTRLRRGWTPQDAILK